MRKLLAMITLLLMFTLALTVGATAQTSPVAKRGVIRIQNSHTAYCVTFDAPNKVAVYSQKESVGVSCSIRPKQWIFQGLVTLPRGSADDEWCVEQRKRRLVIWAAESGPKFCPDGP